jgi:hypothetical protein
MDMGSPLAQTQVRQATALLMSASAALTTMSSEEAVALARSFATAEKVAMAAVRRAALVCGDRGAQRHGGEPSAAAFVAAVTGTTVAKARASLVATVQANEVPRVAQALFGGALSMDQATVLAPAATASPEAIPRLLEEAGNGSLSTLRHLARSVTVDEEPAVQSERLLHRRRHLTISHPASGGVRLEALFGPVEGAAVMAAIERAKDRLLKEAWGRGEQPSPAHLRADALCRLVTGGGDASGPRAPVADLLVRVDAAALVRGAKQDGETCEIAGVGPVSVEAARALLGEGFLTLLVADGADIRTVTSTTRVVPTKVHKALMLRDPACVVPGCGASSNLETDHWRYDFAAGGLSALSNLCRLCSSHHRLKTRTGWRLRGGPGRWRWLPPRPLPPGSVPLGSLPARPPSSGPQHPPPGPRFPTSPPWPAPPSGHSPPAPGRSPTATVSDTSDPGPGRRVSRSRPRSPG